MEFTRQNRTGIFGGGVLTGAAAFLALFMVGGHSDEPGPHAIRVLFAAPLSPAHAETPMAAVTRMETASAVNLVGRQRMLSQRMAKAYLMLGQGVAADDARAILRESITEFESNLAALKAFQPTPGVRSALAKLEGVWTKCKPLLAAAPSKADAAKFYDTNEALQDAAHNATLAYEHVTGAPFDHLIGMTGRQHMLLQRMAKFYFYRTWGLYDAPAEMELHLSRARFTAELHQIENSPLASAKTKAGVAQIRREWEPYQRALFANRDPAKMRGDAPRVAELSERVSVATAELVAQLMALGAPS